MNGFCPLSNLHVYTDTGKKNLHITWACYTSIWGGKVGNKQNGIIHFSYTSCYGNIVYVRTFYLRELGVFITSSTFISCTHIQPDICYSLRINTRKLFIYCILSVWLITLTYFCFLCGVVEVNYSVFEEK